MEQSDLLIGLSSNLLRLSELDAQVIRQYTVFRLDEQIRRTVLFLQPLWEAKNIELDIDLDTAEYSGDEELLRQVWLNLIHNAIKFTGDGDTVKIALKNQADRLLVHIQDSGVGISPDELPHIFDRFYKGDKARKGKGNGLGLSLVLKILEQAGGSIAAESELGAGTSMSVELPRSIPEPKGYRQ